MQRTLILSIAVLLSVSGSILPASSQEPLDPGAEETIIGNRPWEAIDVAIALDTSGSMEPLIEAARLKLWEIVEQMTVLEPTPELRVALLTFGNGKNDRRTGWVRVENDFTTDLDLVSNRLFELTSEGGNEYVGRVIQIAVEQLRWTESDDALKLLFVAGNEAADQDPEIMLETAVDLVDDEGVMLHVIFCGQPNAKDAESWARIAEMTGRSLATIDHRSSPVTITSPYDQELAKLGAALNDTFVPLGEAGQERKERLIQQDKKVEELSLAAAASRAEVKSSRLYASGWDLVDAIEAGSVDLYALDDAQLPEPLQSMTPDDLWSYLESMKVRRAELREQIAALSRQRRDYVATHVAKKGIDTSRSFDTVVREAIRQELDQKGFTSPEEPE